jgi:hypothetical protein
LEVDPTDRDARYWLEQWPLMEKSMQDRAEENGDAQDLSGDGAEQ